MKLMSLFFFYVQPFALSLPVSANSELPETPKTTEKPQMVIPEIVDLIQADPEMDDHVIDLTLDNLAQKEKVNEDGETVNNADFNLNLRAVKETLEENDLILFHLMKQVTRSIINGMFNHVYDCIRNFFQSPVSSFAPDFQKTSVFDFIIWLIYRLTIFGLVLRLLIFCCPFRPIRAILLRIQYWTMCL